MKRSAALDHALQGELLCIADSNWVLGHWYINCLLNGRELTDFTSMAGIAEEKLGHARALFRFMEEYYDLPEFQLEFARDASQIHAMELLDAPPRNWSDFILTLHLADKALWRFANTLRDGNFAPVTNLVTKFGEEAYFHQLCIDGWLNALDEPEQQALDAALPERLPHVFRWFIGEQPDPLIEAGIRSEPLDQASATLAANMAKVFGAGARRGTNAPSSAAQLVNADNWDTRRRRMRDNALPPRLWESMVPTSEAATLARRPLAVSVDDNIDLFAKQKKDDTEPQF